MIVAHLSDLHLGFRAYGRVERGLNLRERDVAAAFERAIREIIRLRPDVVLVAGDVFDRPDPAPSAVVTLARGFEALRAELPEVPLLLIAGPRDTPRREGDPGALAVLDTYARVEAATTLMRSVLIDRLDLHVCLVPHRAVTSHPLALPEPDPRRRWNVLVMHAAPGAPGSAYGVTVDARDWDYVALGGEHRRRMLAPRVRHAGSLERVALDPWDDATDEKGFLSVELESGRVEFHRVVGRPVVALAPVRVDAGEPERVRKRVLEVTGEVPGGIDGKIVRLSLEGATPRDLLALQGPLLEELRGRALHLSVEAAPEPRTPPHAPSPGEAARAIREALRTELERDGQPESVVRRADVGPSASEDDPRPLGTLDALDGRLPGLGRVSTSVPPGVTAVFGGDGRTRRALAELILRVGGGALPDPPDAAGELWRAIDVHAPERMLRLAVRAVAEVRGLGLMEEALGSRVGEADEASGAPIESGSGAPLPAGAAGPDPVRRANGDVLLRPSALGPGSRREGRADPAARRELERARELLRDLRAEVVETDGDVAAAMMDWLRERQDAETTLHAHRDRARELRTRLRHLERSGPEAACPTCGRVLAEHHERVRAELGEEWEAVVQDGSWWRSRWNQLESKPERLRELERRSVRLHAELETAAERVELLRARMDGALGATDGTSFRGSGPPGVDASPDPVRAALVRVAAARLARARERVLDRASRFLCRLSGGRILAATVEQRRVLLQGTAGVLTPMSDEDLALVNLAIRLAGATLVTASGRRIDALLVGEAFDRLDTEARHRALALLRAVARDIPRLFVVTRGDSVDARPELFDFLLEVRDDAGPDRPLLRPTAGGPGRMVLRGAAEARPPLRPEAPRAS